MGKRVRTEAFKHEMGREHDVRYPFGGPLRSNIDVYSSGWWLSSSDPIRWNPGLDHPSYKIPILWLDQAGISTRLCAGKI